MELYSGKITFLSTHTFDIFSNLGKHTFVLTSNSKMNVLKTMFAVLALISIIFMPSTSAENNVYLSYPGCGVRPSRESRNRVKRIVGGTEAEVNSWPWMGGLVNKKKIVCGATLISKKFALTAAHCFQKTNGIGEYGVVLGEHSTETGLETNATVFHLVEKILRHPDYLDGKPQHNIALVQLMREVKLSERINPVCLPTFYQNIDIGYKVTVTGWGVSAFTGPLNSELQEITLPIFPIKECNQIFSGYELRDDTIICTWDKEGGKAPCQMDSGDPMVIEVEDNRWILLGVLVGGTHVCGEGPDLFANLYHYRDWLMENTYLGGK